ncbi:hypothetical protein CKO51_03975 [Rhodopirellula sp. SM50]|nr:hypothetical protein [Rhodopirellula sp. SM50]PAY20905.1 hypothetical protein CKO51_03975 [Rhodopirellula sp. SM50]
MDGDELLYFVYLDEYHIVLMMMAYPKNRKDNLSASDKTGIKKYLAITEKWLEENSRRKPRD